MIGERIERSRMQRQYLSCYLRADGSAVTAPGNPNHDIMGDLAPIDTAPAAGVQIGYDALGNVLTDPNTPEVGRADTLHYSTGNDHITGGAGDDLIYANRSADDVIETGAGRDYAYGAAGQDVMAGGAGTDTLVGSSARDVLTGGDGADLLIGGAGDDNILGDRDWVAQGFSWTVVNQADGTRFSLRSTSSPL